MVSNYSNQKLPNFKPYNCPLNCGYLFETTIKVQNHLLMECMRKQIFNPNTYHYCLINNKITKFTEQFSDCKECLELLNKKKDELLINLLGTSNKENVNIKSNTLSTRTTTAHDSIGLTENNRKVKEIKSKAKANLFIDDSMIDYKVKADHRFLINNESMLSNFKRNYFDKCNDSLELNLDTEQKYIVNYRMFQEQESTIGDSILDSSIFVQKKETKLMPHSVEETKTIKEEENVEELFKDFFI